MTPRSVAPAGGQGAAAGSPEPPDSSEAPALEGWALNVSRGGVRVILEEKVELGAEFDIELHAESGLDVTRAGRVVWLQDEPDGTIVGIEFMGELPSEPPRA